MKNDGWTVTKDAAGYMGPYASKHDQWVSYDEVSDVARKVCTQRRLHIHTRVLISLICVGCKRCIGVAYFKSGSRTCDSQEIVGVIVYV